MIPSMNKSLRGIVALTLAAGIATVAPSTVQADGPGFRPYLGAGVGLTRLTPDATEIPETVTEEDGTALNAILGLDLNHRFGFQLGYTDLGQAGLSNGDHVSYKEVSGDLLVYGFASELRRQHRRGLLPYGRVGLALMDNNSETPFIRDNDLSIAFGAGLEYATRSGLAARAEVTSFDVDALHAGLSLVFRFGGHDDHPVPVIGAAEPVTEAAPVTPSVVDAEPVQTLRFPPIFFATDSAQLDAEAKRQVALIAKALKNHPDSEGLIAGFADLRASVPYNLALSQRRANAVLDELARLGINVDNFVAQAMGETNRFGSMATAEGRLMNRRVEVEATPKAKPAPISLTELD